MVRVGIISDTHASIHEKVFDFLKDCDEIWHAGDIGNLETLEEIARFKPTIAVYGNCDGTDIRQKTKEYEFFKCEDRKVMMTHIGGYPGRYPPHIRQIIREKKPDILVTGHSHILKVMYDKTNKLMYLNPGAAGQFGFHKNITCLRFTIDGAELKDMQVLDVERQRYKAV